MNKTLLRYIPKEFKPFVVDIYEGDKEFDEIKRRWNTRLVVEWQNGERSEFTNKSWALTCLKEVYMIEDVKEV